VNVPPFRPPRWLRGGHRQTLWSNYAPRDASAIGRLRAGSRTEEIATGQDRLRLHWFRGDEPSRPLLVVLHGLTGCADAPQVTSLAAKAVARGLDVVRVDMRNASGRTPSRHVGHAGRSEDLRAVLARAAEVAPDAPTAVIGYSLGGNVTLKALGEYGDAPPASLRAAAVVSVPVDLDAACHAIDRADNRIYRHYFVRRLVRTVRERARSHPEIYASIADLDLASLGGIREFDDRVVAPLCGFAGALDYYRRCSSIECLPDIRVPTLLIAAKDDPFVPFEMYRRAPVVDTAALRLLATNRGGHVGFWARTAGDDPDRFWAENRALDFVSQRLT
jgi:predicted alpha/beta-fold hydrolase